MAVSRKWFTIVGYWEDNAQPAVYHVRAGNIWESVRLLRTKLEKLSWADDTGLEQLIIVEIFNGKHKGRSGEDTTLPIVAFNP
jgi:hypothetical protein